MAVYHKFGQRREAALPISLLDAQGCVLPFLNSGCEADALSARLEWSLAIPLDFSRIPPAFFPEWEARFTVGTDDGEAFDFIQVEQNGQQGLAFSDDFDPACYFRRRLNVPDNRAVTPADLERYGASGFLLFRLEEYLFLLDFSADTAPALTDKTVLLETDHAPSAWRRAREEAFQREDPLYPGALALEVGVPASTPHREMVVVRRHSKPQTSPRYWVMVEQTAAE